MKSSFKILSLLLVSSVILWSCEKDETRVVLNPGGNTQLTSTATSLVLLQSNAANNAVTFNWGKASFGYDAAVNYTLQIAKAGTNFATSSTTEVNMGALLTKSFTVSEFNNKLNEIIQDGTATGIELRIKSDVGSGVAPIYSNVVAMTATSYMDIITYTFPAAMNVAGNFQGWTPATAPQIVNTKNGGYSGYEGYIVFNNASPEFKMVKGNDWSAGDYGMASATNIGNGGANFTLPGGGAGVAGLYRIRANTTSMTWSYYKINTFGIIGDATPGNWGASTPMTFNPADGSWTITTNLTVGELKFRANNDWAVNFGDNHDPSNNVFRDGKPDYDGNNIPITSAGNYTITLGLGIGGNYYYRIKKN